MAKPTLHVPSNAEPTFWNKDTALGASIGWLGAGPVGAAIGTIIGGVVGSNRIKQEHTEGKNVAAPTFWNRSIVNGAVVGQLASAALAIGAVIAAGFAGVELGYTITKLAVGLTVLGGTIAGAINGGYEGQARMEKEYAQAQEHVAQHGEFKGKGHAQEVAKGQGLRQEQAYTITPQEAQALEARLNAPKAAHGAHTQRNMAEQDMGAAAVNGVMLG